jgi:hypothetical protein
MKNGNGLVLLADDREPDSAVPRINDYGITAITKRLLSGDYMFVAHGLTILIERKTISNLLQSMATKQLVSQAHALIENSDRAFILREGAFGRSPSGHLMYYSPRDPRADSDNWVTSDWTYDSFSGIMLDLQLMGIDFIDCPVNGDYPRELARVVMSLSKKEHGWIRDRQRPEVLTLDKQYKASVWSLCALEGMGPTWAEALIAEFGTLAHTYQTLAEDAGTIAKVKCKGRSFGLKRAKRVQEEMLKQWT